MARFNFAFLNELAANLCGRRVACTLLPEWEETDGMAWYADGVMKIGLHPSLLGRPGWSKRLPYAFLHECGHIACGHVPEVERTGDGLSLEDCEARLDADPGDVVAASVKSYIERVDGEADDWAMERLPVLCDACESMVILT